MSSPPRPMLSCQPWLASRPHLQQRGMRPSLLSCSSFSCTFAARGSSHNILHPSLLEAWESQQRLGHQGCNEDRKTCAELEKTSSLATYVVKFKATALQSKSHSRRSNHDISKQFAQQRPKTNGDTGLHTRNITAKTSDDDSTRRAQRVTWARELNSFAEHLAAAIGRPRPREEQLLLSPRAGPDV